jgi:sodium/proline symporter
MSTADSQLLVISSSVIEDFYVKTLGRELSQKRLLFLSRAITLSVGILGFVIAATSEKLIFTLVSYAWAGLGSSFGPALLLALKWKKTTKHGVLAGMITGAVTTIIWQNIEALDGMISVRFTSFIFAFIIIIIVSYATQKKND